MTVTRLSAPYIVGFNGRDHMIIRDGCVVYKDAHITFVGTNFPHPVDVDHDYENAIISPGFIDLDALADIDHSILDAWYDGNHALGFEWSETYASTSRRHVFTSTERLFAREFAMRQLLLNGVTTAMPIAAETHAEWAESFEDLMAMAHVAERLGLRMYLGSSFRDGVNVVTDGGDRSVHWDKRLGRQGLEDAVRLVRELEQRGSALVRGCLLPSRIETQTPETLRTIAHMASELDCVVRLHALQSTTELHQLQLLHSSTPLQLLDEAGLLGQRLLIPHMFYLGGFPRDNDQHRSNLELLAAREVTLVHCPVVAMRVARPLDSFDVVRDAGITIALGTDTFPPDIIRNMDAGVNMAKLVTRRTDAANPAELFRAATLGGAKALQRNDLGRLAEGALADIVVIDLGPTRVGVVDDPIRTMVANCSGENVLTSVVHGRTIVSNGATVDGRDEEFRDGAQAMFERMREAYTERDYRKRPPEELFPSSFSTYPATAAHLQPAQ